MSLWWLEPGWKSATCGCGANIWNSGGDPDMGRCHDCAMAHASEQRHCQEIEREHERQIAAEYEEYLRAEQAATVEPK